MQKLSREMMQEVLTKFEAKDVEGVVALFAPDGALIDPHYPQPMMQGHEAIRDGLEDAFMRLEQPGFTIRSAWLDQESGVMEVATHHRLMGGIELDFPQVFVVEVQDGLIKRMQSYVPYPPPAMPA